MTDYKYPMPSRLEPVPYLVVIGLVLAFGAISFVSNVMTDKQHKAQHQAINASIIAEAATHCAPGTRITIIEGNRKTCITELKRTFAASDRRVYVGAR